MSFMFKPHPYNDPTAVNRPDLLEDTLDSIISGTANSAHYLSESIIKKLQEGNGIVVAFDGYMGAEFEQTMHLISEGLRSNSVEVEILDFKTVIKASSKLDEQFAENLEEDLEKDPVLLFGKLFKGGFEDLVDRSKLEAFMNRIKSVKDSPDKVLFIYGNGCTLKELRPLYNTIVYFDLAPKEVILRARNGNFANIGDERARPIKALLRRCYYIDFEVTGHLRWNLLNENAIDYYIDSNHPDNLQLIPKEAFNSIMDSLVKYPVRCRPVYLEGVWGGHYITNLRNLPGSMKNCAWSFELIPLEVSIVVEAGKQLLEFPFFTFVQKEGEALMGKEAHQYFGGYFPIRFNYDDSYHSSGNMSIQLHSGHEYNVENYGEHGRQDESYYIIATGHGAKTYVGFNSDVHPGDFVREAKKSEKEFTLIDYQKYIHHIESKPGTQVLIPAGTIHSSGRNQLILEIGSLTIGSYTYKMYDYLRADLDGKPRPIHTYHGEKVIRKDANESWVKDNLVQQPRLACSGEEWAEYVVGEHELLYYSLRRLEFETMAEGDTNGKFHVLTLVDGEKVVVQSLENPELCYYQNYLDVVVVPANMGKYVIRNLGNQPVVMHKTMLKDGFFNDRIHNN